MFKRIVNSFLISRDKILFRRYNSCFRRNISTFKTQGNILVTGACGQIGTELVPFIAEKYGANKIIATDIKLPKERSRSLSIKFENLDIQNIEELKKLVNKHRVTTIIHLASLLSAIGEKNPIKAMNINGRGIENILETARINHLKVFAPSSIAAFGPTTPKNNTPQNTIMRPNTIYGITKVYTELLGEYYHQKFGVDFRSLRYPGIISSEAMAGGGTTDYAVEIFYDAIRKGKFECFLDKHTVLPMMYMKDTIHATMQFIETPSKKLNYRSYNITGMSFSPDELVKAIQKIIPSFKVTYKPDYRQGIADSWPKSIDDSDARKDWGWNPIYNLKDMVKEMIERLKNRII